MREEYEIRERPRQSNKTATVALSLSVIGMIMALVLRAFNFGDVLSLGIIATSFAVAAIYLANKCFLREYEYVLSSDGTDAFFFIVLIKPKNSETLIKINLSEIKDLEITNTGAFQNNGKKIQKYSYLITLSPKRKARFICTISSHETQIVFEPTQAFYDKLKSELIY